MAVDCYRDRWNRSWNSCSHILDGGKASNYAHSALFDGILRRRCLDHGHC